MVFGYSTAIIAGFILTAMRNWTGVRTINGRALMVLVGLWLLARVLPLLASPVLFRWAAIMDVLFLFGVMLAVIHPIAKGKQWQQQIAILSKIILLLAANILYYLGVFQVVEQGISWGIYSGVYLIIALIFTFARRVMPLFIERGVDYSFKPRNSTFIDITSLVLLTMLWIVDVFFHHIIFSALISLVLAVLHTIRLAGWYTKGIWHKPLLWVLFIGYGMFVVGFMLKAINVFDLYSTMLPLHAFTYGGIGMMTIGMMARISLVHTGRNIKQPSSILAWVFLCLLLGALIRVVMPIFLPEAYLYFIGASQLLWIISFTSFLFSYLMIFVGKSYVGGHPHDVKML